MFNGTIVMFTIIATIQGRIKDESNFRATALEIITINNIGSLPRTML